MPLNKTMLIGNVGRDAELRYTGNGTAVADFSLAVNRNWRGTDGERREETNWFKITLWGTRAERVSQYITKGSQLYVEGRLQIREVDDDEGHKRTYVDVVANDVQFVGGRREDMSGNDFPTSTQDDTQTQDFPSLDSDDLPFE